MKVVKENGKWNLTEGFNDKEKQAVKDIVQLCFREKGNKGVRDEDTLNDYLGKLDFEVDASEIKVGGWKSNSYNRQIKSAEVTLQGKYLTMIQT